MTRGEAITLAVRRHWKLVPSDENHRRAIIACGYPVIPWQDEIDAIRAHFRAVCRAYDVREDGPKKYPLPKNIWAVINSGAEPDYDGHSLRT